MIRLWFRALSRKFLSDRTLWMTSRPVRRRDVRPRLELLEERTVTTALPLAPAPAFSNAIDDADLHAPALGSSLKADQDAQPLASDWTGDATPTDPDTSEDSVWADAPPEADGAQPFPSPALPPEIGAADNGVVPGLDSPEPFGDDTESASAFSDLPASVAPGDPAAPTSLTPEVGGVPDVGLPPVFRAGSTVALAVQGIQVVLSDPGTAPPSHPPDTASTVPEPPPAGFTTPSGEDEAEPPGPPATSRGAQSPGARHSETVADFRGSGTVRPRNTPRARASVPAVVAATPEGRTKVRARPADVAAARSGFGRLPADLPDGALLQRFVADQEQAAFTALVQRYAQFVLGVCRRVLGDSHAAQDAFQATFLVLARKAGGLDREGPLAGWLHKVAYHLALRLRAVAARQRRQERAAAGGRSAEDADESPLRIERQEMCEALNEELQRLPEKYRVPLVLCFLDGRTHAEAAAVIGLPRGSMAKRIGEGLEHLRERLRHRGIGP